MFQGGDEGGGGGEEGGEREVGVAGVALLLLPWVQERRRAGMRQWVEAEAVGEGRGEAVE